MLNWDALSPAVERAAATAAGKFPDHHDINDVKQTLWVWVMEKKSTVMDILEKSEGSDQLLVNMMTKVAMTHLKGEDAAVYGYDEEDSFHYSTDLIRNILDVVFQYEDWQSFAMSQDTQPRAKKNPALGGDNLASYADVKSAVEKLSEDHYNLIVWRYKYRYTFLRIGEEVGITRQGAQDRHRAALSALQRSLGKKDLAEFRRGFTGRTEARGNASSQAQIERDWEG